LTNSAAVEFNSKRS